MRRCSGERCLSYARRSEARGGCRHVPLCRCGRHGRLRLEISIDPSYDRHCADPRTALALERLLLRDCVTDEVTIAAERAVVTTARVFHDMVELRCRIELDPGFLQLDDVDRRVVVFGPFVRSRLRRSSNGTRTREAAAPRLCDRRGHDCGRARRARGGCRHVPLCRCGRHGRLRLEISIDPSYDRHSSAL
jgi:hypothetical protein